MKNQHNIKVSVIMACYNAASFLEQAITSVIEQTYKNIELIIVNDASSDNSLSLAQEMALKDSRISVYSLTENVGPAAARNVAIEKAQGKWIANLDADDVFLNTKIERQMSFIDNANSDIIVVGTDSYHVNARGQRISVQHYPINNRGLVNGLTKGKRFPPHSSIIYRTSAIRSLGGFNVRLMRSEDKDLLLRLIGLGEMASIPEPLVEYRIHDSNISRTGAEFGRTTYTAAAMICHFLRNNSHFDPSRSSSEEWNAFMEWLDRRLLALHFNDFSEAKVRAKGKYSKSQNRLLGIMHFTHELVRKKYLGRFISERLFGSYLFTDLAREWSSSAQHSKEECL